MIILSAGLLFGTKKCGAAITKIVSSEILIGILIINKRQDDKKKLQQQKYSQGKSLGDIREKQRQRRKRHRKESSRFQSSSLFQLENNLERALNQLR